MWLISGMNFFPLVYWKLSYQNTVRTKSVPVLLYYLFRYVVESHKLRLFFHWEVLCEAIFLSKVIIEPAIYIIFGRTEQMWWNPKSYYTCCVIIAVVIVVEVVLEVVEVTGGNR